MSCVAGRQPGPAGHQRQHCNTHDGDLRQNGELGLCVVFYCLLLWCSMIECIVGCVASTCVLVKSVLLNVIVSSDVLGFVLLNGR